MQWLAHSLLIIKPGNTHLAYYNGYNYLEHRVLARMITDHITPWVVVVFIIGWNNNRFTAIFWCSRCDDNVYALRLDHLY